MSWNEKSLISLLKEGKYMGWRFSKSINLGPVRVNLSKSGVGWSVGGKGFRAGFDSKGRKYNNISIPGTGLSKRTYEDNSANQAQSNPQTNNSNGVQISWPTLVFLFLIFSSLKLLLK